MFAYGADKKEKYYRLCPAILTLLAVIFGGIVTGLCSLYFASSRFSAEMFFSYFDNGYILFLNMMPPIVLSVVFYLAFNRAVWSFVATNVAVIVPSLINYYKISFRGDCFNLEDISLAFEAGKMLETYKLYIDKRIAAYLVILGVGILLFAVFAKGRIRGRLARGITAVVLAVASGFTAPLYASDLIYEQKTQNFDLINQWSEAQLYISKGFVYPFLHSAKDAFKLAPEGYDSDYARSLLPDDEKIPEDKKVNILAVMLEAYSDFSQFEELVFTEDVYGGYRALKENGYSGKLVTDIFSGDTKVSEREFLTGLPFSRLDNFIAKSNSYVWYLRENGYTTTGAHPCYAWFYNRENINRNLGFESYKFSENYFRELTGEDIVYDARMFREMKELYLSRDKSKPYFSFCVTYQGHGPYDSGVAHYKSPYVVSDHVPEADKNILNNYLNAQKETTALLYTFVMDMLATEEPLVMVFFGDHKPWLGNDNDAYKSYGINIDTSTEDGFMNYYSTEYLILANDSAKKITGCDFAGEGETISVSFLMNKVFELCGYKGNGYMQYTSALMKETPVVHREKDMPLDFDYVSYYYRKNFSY